MTEARHDPTIDPKATLASLGGLSCCHHHWPSAIRKNHLSSFFPDLPRQPGESDIRALAESDPRAFLQAYPAPVIFDEIQRVPQLLSYIQTLVDESGKNGQYLLTGSHQPQLSAGISQSLAGRTGLLRLLPLSIQELRQAGITLERDEYLYKGFMPRAYGTTLEPHTLYSDYFATYVDRDVRQIANLSNLSAFETFMKLLAGRCGQLLNLSSLANDIGVSSPTISSWLSILEASFIIFRLPCYYENSASAC